MLVTREGATGPWLGIDAGASHTEAVMLAEGRSLWQGVAGPVNHMAGDAGRRRMADTFRALIQELGSTRAGRVCGVAVGLSGLGIPGKGEDARAILTELLPGRVVRITSDLVSALVGATSGADGMILLCGTGSAALASTGERLIRVGGRGSLFSDHGSAFAIGRDGVRAALSDADGDGPPTVLGGALANALGVDDAEQIPGRAFAEAWDAARIARLAMVVGTAGAKGDAVARAILRRAGSALGSMAAAAMRRAGGRLPMSLVGRGWGVSPLLWEAASAEFEHLMAYTIEPVPSQRSAAEGAVLWAEGRCSIPLRVDCPRPPPNGERDGASC